MASSKASRAGSGPADLLRDRLTSGNGRLAVIAASSGVWLMDLLLVNHLKTDN